MGIGGFNSWFSSRYPTAFKKATQEEFDHVYVDMPGVLHEVLRKVKTTSRFHQALHKKLDEILRLTGVRKSFMLALDGPAPLAKLVTQRTRRQKEARKGKEGKGELSSLGLTPGTSFMIKVQQSLLFYVCSRLLNRSNRHLFVEVSDSTVQGEGEVKILYRLSRPTSPVTPACRHVIIGNDSDLLLLALLTPVPNVYIMLDSPVNSVFSGYRLFSVAHIEELWTNDYVRRILNADDPTPQDVSRVLLSLKLDMAALSIISSGNDYLPATRGLFLKTMWESYIRMRCLPKGKDRHLVRAAGQGVVFDHKFVAELLESEAVHLSGPAFSVGPQQLEDAQQYLEGLQWNLTMYLHGKCPKYRWTYSGRSLSPHALMQVLRSTSTDESGGGNASVDATRDDLSQSIAAAPRIGQQLFADEPLVPVAHALALLPLAGRSQLPAAVHHLMEENSPIYQLYRECTTCNTLLSKLNHSVKAQLRVREAIVALQKASESCTPSPALNDKMSKLTKAASKARMQLREVNESLIKHREQEHSGRFPLESVEAAVKAVPEEHFQPHELPLTQFGSNFVLRYFPRPGSQVDSQDIAPPAPHANAVRKGYKKQKVAGGTTGSEGDGAQSSAVDASVSAFLARPDPPVASWSPLPPKLHITRHVVVDLERKAELLPCLHNPLGATAGQPSTSTIPPPPLSEPQHPGESARLQQTRSSTAASKPPRPPPVKVVLDSPSPTGSSAEQLVPRLSRSASRDVVTRATARALKASSRHAARTVDASTGSAGGGLSAAKPWPTLGTAEVSSRGTSAKQPAPPAPTDASFTSGRKYGVAETPTTSISTMKGPHLPKAVDLERVVPPSKATLGSSSPLSAGPKHQSHIAHSTQKLHAVSPQVPGHGSRATLRASWHALQGKRRFSDSCPEKARRLAAHSRAAVHNRAAASCVALTYLNTLVSRSMQSVAVRCAIKAGLAGLARPRGAFRAFCRW